ncbi:MAG: hypothetical protein JWO31_557 [Phycisphaerales bacterium]|nr:hypothetical protein [Phycisphaerales bacterium]
MPYRSGGGCQDGIEQCADPPGVRRRGRLCGAKDFVACPLAASPLTLSSFAVTPRPRRPASSARRAVAEPTWRDNVIVVRPASTRPEGAAPAHTSRVVRPKVPRPRMPARRPRAAGTAAPQSRRPATPGRDPVATLERFGRLLAVRRGSGFHFFCPPPQGLGTAAGVPSGSSALCVPVVSLGRPLTAWPTGGRRRESDVPPHAHGGPDSRTPAGSTETAGQPSSAGN